MPQCWIIRFFYHSDFTWNRFWGFLKRKSCLFSIFGLLIFINLANFTLKKCKTSWKSKFRASNCVKMADFALQKSTKLISRKFWVIENLCNFYTVCLNSRDFNLLRPSILLIFYRSNLTQITNSLLLTLANQNISQFSQKKSKSWHHCQKFRQINNFLTF